MSEKIMERKQIGREMICGMVPNTNWEEFGAGTKWSGNKYGSASNRAIGGKFFVGRTRSENNIARLQCG